MSTPGILQRSPLARTVLLFVTIAVGFTLFADIAVTTVDPWHELARLAASFITPDFSRIDTLLEAVLNTVCFAILGVAFGNFFGFFLALFFHNRLVRTSCAIVRAVHELFWALIFIQIFGLSPLTGILAIGIPYGGIIAKVYAEILEEADLTPMRLIPEQAGRLSRFLYGQLPLTWPHLKAYSLYRFECGLRSSAVLGFIGLPTLGYHLEAVFRQGQYSEAWAILFLFYILIATVRHWMHRALVPIYALASLWILDWNTQLSGGNAWRFFTQDIVPAPLRDFQGESSIVEFGQWLLMLLRDQALPGAIATIQLSTIAMVATGILMMVLYPLVSSLLFKRWERVLGHSLLVILRSTPEYIIAFVLLQMLGPSMLPAIIALAVHNGAIIGHLGGQFSSTIQLRPDASRGFNRYVYEVTPRIYRQMLALLFYRWEVIMRETAILGMLGIGTLGFYISSAFADLRLDRAVFLIGITALLNIGIDQISRQVRQTLRLQTTPQGR